MCACRVGPASATGRLQTALPLDRGMCWRFARVAWERAASQLGERPKRLALCPVVCRLQASHRAFYAQRASEFTCRGRWPKASRAHRYWGGVGGISAWLKLAAPRFCASDPWFRGALPRRGVVGGIGTHEVGVVGGRSAAGLPPRPAPLRGTIFVSTRLMAWSLPRRIAPGRYGATKVARWCLQASLDLPCLAKLEATWRLLVAG